MAEDFKNCGATVQFIRNIDRLFDLLNSRHPMMKGFKSPISKSNLSTVQNQVRKVCEYLLSLKASDSQLLAENRRKSFILGFVSAAKSIIAIAEDLLTRESNQLKYLLTYKFSQDHIELLFSCIRSRGGFNNNPNALQFKTALRQILLRNSIMASNKANVICFEDQAHGSIFSLKASKRRTPISDILEQPSSEEDAEDNDGILLLLFDGIEFTSFLENILYYISGFIVRKIANKIDCEQCAEALAFPTSSMDHPYVNLPFSFAMLVVRKNRGGLVQASYGAFKVVEHCEKAFKLNVLEGGNKAITSKPHLVRKMIVQVLAVCDWGNIFPNIKDHRFEVDTAFEDDHVTQLVKRISTKYLTVRLQTYAKRYTRQVINKNIPSIRHKMSKLVLFKNI
eukprot:gene9936-18544_t